MPRLLTLLIVALLFSRAAAGTSTVSLSAASPGDENNVRTLTVTKLEAVCTIRGALARTEVTLTLAADAPPGERMEGRLIFPQPPDCVVTGAALDIGPVMRIASLTFKEIAQSAYDSVVRRMVDPCLVKLLPDGRVSVQVFPITAETPRRLRLEFAQILTPSPQGLTWQFPVLLPAPVAEVTLTLDAPHLPQHGTSLRRNFTGGEAWSLTAPLPAADAPLAAHPDGSGRFVFHGLLPVSGVPAPPRHLLVLADASWLQKERDKAAERAFVAGLLQRMGAGRVTLAVFSTALHYTAEYEVRDGKCEALLHALDTLAFDGAPRPGAVDVSGIPADLTLISSTLAGPMGGGPAPRVPAKAPVLVMDSVSSHPGPAARRLADETGGATFDPRQPGEPLFHPRLAVSGESITNVTARLLPGGQWWLVTGELAAGSSGQRPAGDSLTISKGTDTTAGLLTAQYADRERMVRFAEESPGFRRRARLPDSQTAPCLTESTAFIVLEQPDDYRKHGIPFPPDLASEDQDERAGHDQPVTDIDCLAAALTRPPGVPGDPATWHQQLQEGKRESLRPGMINLWRYNNRRTANDDSEWGDWPFSDAEFKERTTQAARAARELLQLAEKFPAALPDAAADLIRQGREQQRAKIALIELMNPDFWGGVFRSGGYTPTADPFSGPATMDDAVGRFRDTHDPFDASRRSDANSVSPAPAVLADYQSPAKAGGRSIFVILTSAETLRRAGQKAEAIRVLSNLAGEPQPDHGLLRLLAWQLIEWQEAALALEVMRHTERLFGSTATTERDIALAALEAGQSALAAEHFARATGGVACREASALSGKGPADFRIVLECANANADADLEIEGSDFEVASWRNPLPAFGGALSFDARGFEPEDFLLPTGPAAPLVVRIRLLSEAPAAVRLTVFHQWARPEQKREVFLLPQCQPGVTNVVELSPQR